MRYLKEFSEGFLNRGKGVIRFKEVDKNEIEIDDTGVCDEVGGEGVGKKLVNRVVEDGGEKNLKIMAFCV
ncbi:N-acetyltransferase, partial [Staphylococcus epidermidis]|uniref:N-acetyltransferase n=1 Tax=Staphylococcus epidermidis TaxID=1282 RepID=UPI00119F508F